MLKIRFEITKKRRYVRQLFVESQLLLRHDAEKVPTHFYLYVVSVKISAKYLQSANNLHIVGFDL